MAYLISWLFYLVAFLAGALVTWLLVRSQFPTLNEARASVRADKSDNNGGSR